MMVRAYATDCAAALGVSDRSFEQNVFDAYALVVGFPAVTEHTVQGVFSPAHAKAVMVAADPLPTETHPVFEEQVLKKVTPGMSVGQVRLVARRVAEQLDPEVIEVRYERAVEERRVWVTDMPDGMAELGAYLPKVTAYGVYDRLTRVAKAVRKDMALLEREQKAEAEAAAEAETETETETEVGTSPEAEAAPEDAETAPGNAASGEPEPAPRNPQLMLGELRADILADLLLTGTPDTLDVDVDVASTDTDGEASGGPGTSPKHGVHGVHGPRRVSVHRRCGGITGQVTLIVPSNTEMGNGIPDATLEGCGVIDGPTARRLLAEAPGWDRVALNREGVITATDRRSIPPAIRRVLRARDARCRFVGCVMPGALTEIDHTVEWANGGPTKISNLGLLCRRHHVMKHPHHADHVRWNTRQFEDGVFAWESPLGAVYQDRPARRYAGDDSGGGASSGVSGDAGGDAPPPPRPKVPPLPFSEDPFSVLDVPEPRERLNRRKRTRKPKKPKDSGVSGVPESPGATESPESSGVSGEPEP